MVDIAQKNKYIVNVESAQYFIKQQSTKMNELQRIISQNLAANIPSQSKNLIALINAVTERINQANTKISEAEILITDLINIVRKL